MGGRFSPGLFTGSRSILIPSSIGSRLNSKRVNCFTKPCTGRYCRLLVHLDVCTTMYPWVLQIATVALLLTAKASDAANPPVGLLFVTSAYTQYLWWSTSLVPSWRRGQDLQVQLVPDKCKTPRLFSEPHIFKKEIQAWLQKIKLENLQPRL